MSLIFGINLSDRVYITADTRLTYRQTPSSEPMYYDNLCKVESLNANVVVAVAGDARLGGHIIRMLKGHEISRLPYSQLRDGLEAWLGPRLHRYFAKRGNRPLALLLSATDPHSPKVVDGKLIGQRIKELSGQEDYSGTMKQSLMEAITARGEGPNPYPEIAAPSTGLLSVRIDPNRGIFDLRDIPWGHYIAHGPQCFVQEDIPLSLFGALEFKPKAGDHNHDQAQLISFTVSTAKDKNLDTVGGAVVVSGTHNEHGVILATGTLYEYGKFKPPYAHPLRYGTPRPVSHTEVIDNKIYVGTGNGGLVELIPVSEYRMPMGEAEI